MCIRDRAKTDLSAQRAAALSGAHGAGLPAGRGGVAAGADAVDPEDVYKRQSPATIISI